MNILIVQLRQLGDILLTTPVTKAIRKAYPQAKIDFATYSMGRLIIPGNPYVSGHIIAPQANVLESLLFIRKFRTTHYDLAFDFMGTPRSAILTKLSRAKTRVGFATGREAFYTHVAPRGPSTEYIVKEKFQLLKLMNIPCDDLKLVLPWNERDFVSTQKFFEHQSSNQTSQKLRILLSPTHRREERKWPKSSWIELAKWLIQKNYDVYWAWGPGEQEEVLAYHRDSGNVGSLIPQTTFRELAAFTAQCDLFIGNSNGPSHVAVAVNTPSIQLHGPTDAISWCPETERHCSIQKKRMHEIHLEDVLQKIYAMSPVIEQEQQARQSRGMISHHSHIETLRPNL